MNSLGLRPSTVSLIGSFRQFYETVKETITIFRGIGLEVFSPRGSSIQEEGIPFVRFENDPNDWSNEKIQSVTLHRIMRADFVFVVAPDGYIGRTTCYEIGRIIEKSKPIYFSDLINDLPIHIPDSHIYSASDIASKITQGIFFPQALYHEPLNDICVLEKDLLNGQYNQI